MWFIALIVIFILVMIPLCIKWFIVDPRARREKEERERRERERDKKDGE